MAARSSEFFYITQENTENIYDVDETMKGDQMKKYNFIGNGYDIKNMQVETFKLYLLENGKLLKKNKKRTKSTNFVSALEEYVDFIRRNGYRSMIELVKNQILWR